MITVDKIDDLERFGKIRNEWNELLRNSDSDGLFLTWEWLHTWWRHLAEDRRLHVLTVRRDGELVGIAPFAWRSRRWRRLLPFPALEFLGSGCVGSDYLDVIIRRGEERKTLATLLEHLAGDKLMLELARINGASTSARELAVESSEQGWSATRHTTDVCPFIDLSKHNWESFLQSLGAAHRYNVRRRIKRLQKDWYVSFEHVQTEEFRSVALQTLIELHQRRWRERRSPGVLNTAALIAFHEEFSRLALERGWLRLFVLRLNGQAVAALYGFNYHGTFYFYQAGFDPDPRFSKHSVGLVTMGLALKHAIEEKVNIYDFLRGDEAYKFLWAREKRELVRLELFPPGEHGTFYRQAMKLRSGIKKLAPNPLPENSAESHLIH